MNKLTQIYDQNTIKRIKNIPFSTSNQPDTLIRTKSASGLFTTKDAYKHWLSPTSSSLATHHGTSWKDLWNLSLPQKFIVFGQKLGNNTLLSGKNLHERILSLGRMYFWVQYGGK